MQRSRAPVISQAAPGSQHIGEACTCQFFYGRKAPQKLRVALKNYSYARLLKHHFRHPDAVGVAGAAPRQIATVLAIPTQKFPAKSAGIEGARHACLNSIACPCSPQSVYQQDNTCSAEGIPSGDQLKDGMVSFAPSFDRASDAEHCYW